MTGSIIMLVIGSVLLLPAALLTIIIFIATTGETISSLFGPGDDDWKIGVAFFVMTLIGAGLLWAGIATLPK